MKRDRENMTTGQVAVCLGVAPRTVSGWMDSGELPGHRIPSRGSSNRPWHRRFYRSDVLAFVRKHMPMAHRAIAALSDAGETVVLLVGFGDGLAQAVAKAHQVEAGEQPIRVERAATLFDAGLMVGELEPAVVAVDLSLGRAESLDLTRTTRAKLREVIMVAVAYEDEADAEALREAGFSLVVPAPVSGESLLDAILMVARLKGEGVVT